MPAVNPLRRPPPTVTTPAMSTVPGAPASGGMMPVSGHPARKLADFVAHDGAVRCCTIGPRSGQLLVTGGDDGRVNIWRVGFPTTLRSFDAKKEVTAAVFDGGENRAVAGTAGGTLKGWDLESQKQVMVVPSAHRSAVTVVEVYPGKDTLVMTGGADGVVRLWDTRTSGEYVRYSGNDIPITALRVLKNGKHVVGGTSTGKLLVFDLAAGRIATETHLHRDSITMCEPHPTLPNLVATGSNDHCVKYWNLEGGSLKCVGTSPILSTGVRAGSWVPPTHGTTLATATMDNLRMWSFPPLAPGSPTSSTAALVPPFKTETIDLVDVPWGMVASTWVGENLRAAAATTTGTGVPATATKMGSPTPSPLHMVAASVAGSFVSVWSVNLALLAPLAPTPLHAFSVLAGRGGVAGGSGASGKAASTPSTVEPAAPPPSATPAVSTVAPPADAKPTRHRVATSPIPGPRHQLPRSPTAAAPPCPASSLPDVLDMMAAMHDHSGECEGEGDNAGDRGCGEGDSQLLSPGLQSLPGAVYASQSWAPMPESKVQDEVRPAPAHADGLSRTERKTMDGDDSVVGSPVPPATMPSPVIDLRDSSDSKHYSEDEFEAEGCVSPPPARPLLAEDKVAVIQHAIAQAQEAAATAAAAMAAVTGLAVAHPPPPVTPPVPTSATATAPSTTDTIPPTQPAPTLVASATPALSPAPAPTPTTSAAPVDGAAHPLVSRHGRGNSQGPPATAAPCARGGDMDEAPPPLIPASRIEPLGMNLAAFLPTNNARGFGASRILPPTMASTFTASGRQHAATEQTARSVATGHSGMMATLSYRLQQLQAAGAAWDEGSVTRCLAQVQATVTIDPTIAIAVVKAFRLETGALNLESAAAMFRLLCAVMGGASGGLSPAAEEAIEVGSRTFAAVLAGFAEFVTRTMADTPAAVWDAVVRGAIPPGASSLDAASEERINKCLAFVTAGEGMRAVLKRTITSTAGAGAVAATEALGGYETWRSGLPLPAVARAAAAPAAGP